MHLVSIIVPVYNTEEYIDKCISGIICQTYTNWELILINDGSTDNSLALCRAYAEKDNRIIVLDKNNTGVSDSRNVGLDEASGEFIMFVDADDYWLDDNVLYRFVTTAVENNLDIIRGEYTAVDKCGRFMFAKSISKKRRRYSNRIINSHEFLRYAINNEFFLFLSLFRRNIIGNVRFEKGRIFLEDMQFYSKIVLQDLKCMFIPDCRFYAYRKSGSSISYMVNPKKLKDSFLMCYFFHDLSHKVNNDVIKRTYQNYSLTMYYYTLETIAEEVYYHNKNKYIIDFCLYELKNNICNWILEYGIIKLSIIYYVSPGIGVELFRVKRILTKIKSRAYYLKQKIFFIPIIRKKINGK